MKLWTPAYGKRMTEARKAGRHPRGMVLVTLGLWLDRRWPQTHLLVVPDDAPAGKLDLRMLAGLFCHLVIATGGDDDASTPDKLARAEEVNRLMWHAEATVISIIDVQARRDAMSTPGRSPVWWPMPDYWANELRAAGVYWDPALRRSAA